MDSNSQWSQNAIKLQALSLPEFINRQTDPGKGYAKRFLDVLQYALPPLSMNIDGPWLAGGSIRRLFDGTEGESDFDLFFRDEASLQATKAILLTRGSIVSESDLNVTMSVSLKKEEEVFVGPPAKVQLIKFYFPAPEAVLDWFDYTNCQFITDGNSLLCGRYTLYDIGRKHLRLNAVHHAASTLRRMLKYGRQGYTVCDGTINELLLAVADDPDIINSEVRYVD